MPFSILARHAFIGKSFLRSMVELKLITQTDHDNFLRSVQTVTSLFVQDLEKAQKDSLFREKFFDKYGHLRPGTYDILSLRYDQRADILHKKKKTESKNHEQPTFRFSGQVCHVIDEELTKYGFSFGHKKLFDYIKQSMQAREHGKLIFTKAISECLENIINWGEEIGISKDELSFLSIDNILETTVFSTGIDLVSHLREKSARNKKRYDTTRAIRLPHLIVDPEDAPIVPLLLHLPNFITHQSVKGKPIFITGQENPLPEVDRRIVVIENADPGFDWIFSHNIQALITKFGGSNSHMAIRCAEFGIPAAIGCGEQIFERVISCVQVELQCSEERVITHDF